LIKTHRPKGAPIFVFAQKPTLIHEAYSVGDGELEAAGDAAGIMMVCPA
jgi:hypothetical protein